MLTDYLTDVYRETWPELFIVSIFVLVQYFVAVKIFLEKDQIVIGLRVFNACSVVIAITIGYMLVYDTKYFAVLLLVFVLTEIYHFRINKKYKP